MGSYGGLNGNRVSLAAIRNPTAPCRMRSATFCASLLAVTLAFGVCASSVRGGTVLHVDAAATGASTGGNWADAFTDLQAALTVARASGGAVSEIWVAAGTYKPAAPGGDINATFQLVSGVGLYGGFEGGRSTVYPGGETAREQRDPAAHVCVLSGDLNGDDTVPAATHFNENARTVVTVAQGSSGIVLDGLKLSGAASTSCLCRGMGTKFANCSFATGYWTPWAHIDTTESGLDVRGCTFQKTVAVRPSGSATVHITGCTFDGTAVSGGGSAIRMDDCQIRNAGSCGISVTAGELRLTRTVMQGNPVAAINATGAQALYADSCLFRDNGPYGNSTIIAGSATFQLTNCTILGAGSAVQATYGSGTITNCILRGGPDRLLLGLATIAVIHSNIEGGCAGAGNIDADPRFLAPGDYRLRADSPCVDAGTTAVGDLSLNGVSRVLDGNEDGIPVADMGAAECSPGTAAVSLSTSRIDAVVFERDLGPQMQKVTVSSGSLGAISWTAQSSADWLQVSPSTGVADAAGVEVQLVIDPAGLAFGAYTGSVIFSVDGTPGAAQDLTVSLHISRELHVPSNYPTIQAAVDAAGDADHVILADGVYTGPGNHDVYVTKALVVRSEHGAARTTIDCQGQPGVALYQTSSCVGLKCEGLTIVNSEFHALVAAGLTLNDCVIRQCPGGALDCGWLTATNCTFEDNGGRFTIESAATLIENCIFTRNTGSVLLGRNSRVRHSTFQYNASNASGTLSLDVPSNDLATVEYCAFIGNTVAGGSGGGIRGTSGPVIVRNCTFEGNSASEYGGGVCNATEVRDCTFRNNKAYRGAAVYYRAIASYSPTSVISGCRFERNATYEALGSTNAAVDGTYITAVSDCEFLYNTGVGLSLGVVGPRPPYKVVNCRFIGNTRAGARLWYSLQELSQCTFIGNGEGGASIDYGSSSNLQVHNCLFAGNRLGRALDVGLAVVANCTFAYNREMLSSLDIGAGTVSGCVLWGNTNSNGETELAQVNPGGRVLFSCCNIQSWSGMFGGVGNFASDPLFVDPLGPDGVAGTEDDDLRLRPGSPCIDAGSNAGAAAGVTTDLLGLARFVDDPATADTGVGPAPVVDIGAYEYQAASPPAVLAWRSVRTHSGVGELSIRLSVPGVVVPGPGNNIEPRRGAEVVEVDFDQPVQVVAPEAVRVTGWTTDGGVMGGPADYSSLASLQIVDANTLAIAFPAGGLPDGCFSIDIAGAVANAAGAALAGNTSVQLRMLMGDVSGDGTVDYGDLALIKGRMLTSTTPEWASDDVTVDGRVGLADMALIKSRFGRLAACP